jgi:hypothetical protein
MTAHGCRGVAAASLALVAACCAGCMYDIFGGKEVTQAVPPGKVRHGTAPTTQTAAAATDWSSLLPGMALPGAKKEAPPGALRGEQVAEVIEGLQALDRLDPQSRAAVQASLDRTHPANWPYVFRFHREALGGAKMPAGAPLGATPPAPAVAWGFPPNETAAYQARTAPGQPPTAAPPANAMQANRLQTSRPQPTKDSAQIVSPPKAKPRPRQPSESEAPEQRGLADDRESSLERYLRMAGFRAETPAATSHDEDAWPEGPWEGHLEKAIKSLESQAQAGDDPYGQALLRVLYAVAGRRDDALRPIPAVAEAEREFWVNEMRGLTEYLDTRQTGSPDRRAAEAARWFRDAAGRLAELGALDVRNLAFCTAVHSFGSLDRFPKNEFQPGDEVLLYAELENFASESTKAGYRTALKARFDILQGAGRVHEQDLPPAEEVCERQRRDFFLSYHLRLPAGLKSGEYTLQLTIDDTLGRKTATRSIGLRIK